MADRREQRRGAPPRTLIGPLLMLAGGVVTSAMVWRLLMLDPALQVHEPLSSGDRQALDRVLAEQRRP